MNRDGFITLTQAQAIIPTKPSKDTLVRWVQKGIYGHKLRTIRVGIKFWTRPEWVREFLDADRTRPTKREVARSEKVLAGGGE